jgi:TonB-dependent SusC/RagA subfamily outer membrane receptor
MLKKIYYVILALALVSSTSVMHAAVNVSTGTMTAQQGDIATGKVVDKNGEGIVGVGIIVKGTTTGTETNIDGTFQLRNVPKGSTLEISCLGYKTATVVWNGQSVNVTLEDDTTMLEETVVTALGISREKKSLGYAVQDVKADQIARSGGATLTDALQGKIAGLTINNSGTGAGGSTRVVLRGNSSLSDNNEPLYVIDGVPYDTGGHSIDGQAGLWGGVDRASGAFDINPEDVESVSVLKGPTAAALYGSRAGNGVILITTKKGGKTNGKIGVTYTGKFTWSPVAYYLDLQNTWGQGDNGEIVTTSENSWGARMSSSTMVPAWWDSSVEVPYVNYRKPVGWLS